VGAADPFAQGVGGQVAPFAGDLAGTVRESGGSLRGHAVTGARGVAESAVPSHLRPGHYSTDSI
jgi:hypothetical protein